MQQALQECGPAAGAAKNAWLWHPLANFANGTALFDVGQPAPSTACVLAFNGSGSTSEVLLFIRAKLEPDPSPIDCGAPTTNTDGDTSFLFKGDLKANGTVGGDFTDPDNCSAPDPRRGCQIVINNISNGPHTAGRSQRLRSRGPTTSAPGASIHPQATGSGTCGQSSPTRIPPARRR